MLERQLQLAAFGGQKLCQIRQSQLISRMDGESSLPQKVHQTGITLHNEFTPGDLGRLVEIHGVQNFNDYGFGPIHEAYVARIIVDFVLDPEPKRSRIWLAKKAGSVVGSILIVERPGDSAQLRILFVDVAVRGAGLGRWLVEEAVRYCREAKFSAVYLWTAEGLDRAISVYQSLGFVRTEEKPAGSWGMARAEIRYDLKLR